MQLFAQGFVLFDRVFEFAVFFTQRLLQLDQIVLADLLLSAYRQQRFIERVLAVG